MKAPAGQRAHRVVSMTSERQGAEWLVHVKYSSGLVRTRSFTDERAHDRYCQELLRRIARENA